MTVIVLVRLSYGVMRKALWMHDERIPLIRLTRKALRNPTRMTMQRAKRFTCFSSLDPLWFPSSSSCMCMSMSTKLSLGLWHCETASLFVAGCCFASACLDLKWTAPSTECRSVALSVALMLLLEVFLRGLRRGMEPSTACFHEFLRAAKLLPSRLCRAPDVADRTAAFLSWAS